MGKFLIMLAAVLAISASSAQNSEDAMKIPGQYVKQGASISCLAVGGCIVMTPKELSETANAIYRKTLETHTCGLKSNV